MGCLERKLIRGVGKKETRPNTFWGVTELPRSLEDRRRGGVMMRVSCELQLTLVRLSI